MDIDVEGESEEQSSTTAEEPASQEAKGPEPSAASDLSSAKEHKQVSNAPAAEPSPAKNPGQAVPAVRLMLKEHGIDLTDVPGTGKNGRVMKEDVQRYLSARAASQQPAAQPDQVAASDTTVPLTPTENQMFKVMTNSLSIPHFGYTHSVDLTLLNAIRQKCNTRKDFASEMLGKPVPKLTFLPIIMKALSITFQKHPKLNAHLLVGGDGKKPELALKGSHDFGMAVDTPNGLLVPVVRGVQNRSIMSIAQEINRLSELSKKGKLKPSDFKGATFIVSNIGSIGGNAVSPVIVSPMVGIVGVGKLEDIPAFIKDADGDEEIVKRQKAILSWSADHRIIDGASVARCAESVSTILEEIDGVSFALM